MYPQPTGAEVCLLAGENPVSLCSPVEECSGESLGAAELRLGLCSVLPAWTRPAALEGRGDPCKSPIMTLGTDKCLQFILCN